MGDMSPCSHVPPFSSKPRLLPPCLFLLLGQPAGLALCHVPSPVIQVSNLLSLNPTQASHSIYTVVLFSLPLQADQRAQGRVEVRFEGVFVAWMLGKLREAQVIPFKGIGRPSPSPLSRETLGLCDEHVPCVNLPQCTHEPVCKGNLRSFRKSFVDPPTPSPWSRWCCVVCLCDVCICL